ncbi:MAG: immunoglobulin-like domain-containing protein [Acholeplasmataceae bacterium]
MGTKRFSFTKGLFSILVALLLTFTLIACGGDNDQEVLDEAIDGLSVVFASGDSATSVTRDLSLPTTLGEATISWSSNNTSVIANNGTVTRQFSNVTVTLTATATLNEATATKDFSLVVIGHDVDAALEAIVLAGDNITYNASNDRYTVIGNITLPATVNGLTITWESTIPAVLSNAGVVVRPAYGQPDANVTLIASINNEEREFDVLVPAIADKPVSLILQEASDALLIPGISDGVGQNINLPMSVGTQGVTVTWSSSDPAIVSNTGVVVRPDDDNVTVVLTATLSLSGQSITKEFEVVVLAAANFTDVANIAEAISISRSGEDNLGVSGLYVRIKDVTVIGITGDGVVFADDSGILFAYAGMRRSDVVVGGVYDVRGVTARFFGSWQVAGNATEPLVFTESDGDVTVLTPVEVGSVTEMLENHHVPEPTDPDINYVYYRLTAKIRIQNAADNYGTVFVDPDYAGGDVPTSANSPHTEDGVIVYYHSNKAAFDAFDGLVVTFNVLFYGYRSDRSIFSTLFIETVNDIETTLDDQGLVDVAEQTISNGLLPEYSENTTLDLPTSLLGTTITWTSSNTALIDAETGELTLPAEGQETVTLTAVIVKGDVEKEVVFTINVGEMVTISIADARAAAIGVKVQIEGIVTGISYSSSFNNAGVFLQDATGGMFLFRMAGGADVEVGDLIRVVGTRAVFNGLEQLGAGSTYEILSSDNAFIAEELVEADEFIDSQSQYVYVTGTLKAKPSISTSGADNSTVVLVGAKEVVISINHPGDYADVAVRNALIALLEGLDVGDTVSVFGPLGWNNGPRITVYTAADIVVGGYVELNDLEKAEQVAGLLVIPNEIEEAVTLTLPATGAHSSTITYASSDEAVINSETGVVTLPATGNVTVTLTATVTVGTTEFERVETIVVGEIIRTVAYANDAAPGTVVTIEATITVVQFDEREAYLDQAVVFVEDATAGIYLYKVPAEYKAHLVVGNTLKIRANRAVFNDLVQLNNFVSVEVIATGVAVTPTVVTDPAELFNTQGQLVSVTGYLRQVYAGTPSDYHLVTTMGTFALRLASSNDIPQAERTLIINKLVGVAAGTEVTVVAGAGRFRANAQVMLFNADQITIGALGSEAELGAVAAAHFVAPEGDNEVVADITLPTTGLFGSVVEWVSDAPLVIANDGTVVRPLPGSEDAIANLTYELKIGTTVYKTGVVEYTVLAEDDVVYPLNEWRAFVNDWEGTAATLEGVNGELVMTLTNINALNENWKVQVIQDAFALGTGADNVGHMQLEAGKTYKVTFDAKASVAGNITLAIGHAGGGWTPYHVAAGLAVTTEMQTFTSEFTLPAEGDFTTLAQFKLEMGSLFAGQTAPQYFVLDNALIEELVVDTFVATELIVNGEMNPEVPADAPVEVTAAYLAGSGTTNMSGDSNNAALIGLDPTLFTVSSVLNDASVHVGLNNAGQIRIYANRTTGNGNLLTIELDEGYVITGVEFEFGASTNSPLAVLTLGTTESNLVALDLTNTTQTYADLAINSFSLKNTQDSGSSNAQIYILSIKITYELAATAEPVVVTAAYVGGTTNMAASPANNATLIALDETLFTVVSIKGDASVEVGLNSSGQIRIYANRTTGSGNTLEISIAEGYTITGVKFEFGASTNSPTANLVLGDATTSLVAADLTNITQTYTDLSISSFSLFNTQNTGGSGSNAQIYILSIEITYIQN